MAAMSSWQWGFYDGKPVRLRVLRYEPDEHGRWSALCEWPREIERPKGTPERSYVRGRLLGSKEEAERYLALLALSRLGDTGEIRGL